MSMWASEAGRTAQNSNGETLTGMVEIYGTDTTDANGQFLLNLTQFDLVEVLEATATLVGQTLSGADDIVDKLTASIVEVSNTLVKGVVTQPQAIDVTAGVGEIAPIQRGGSGNEVKVKVTGRR